MLTAEKFKIHVGLKKSPLGTAYLDLTSLKAHSIEFRFGYCCMPLARK
jgi:hypothetical protein